MTGLSLDQARAIVEAVIAKARADRRKPIGVAVVDPGGALLALAREERAGALRADIAHAKAWGCTALGFSSRELTRQIEGYPSWFVGIQGVAGGRLVPTPGGVPIRDAAGIIIGAVGVSGEGSEVDEALALHGIDKAGLVAGG